MPVPLLDLVAQYRTIRDEVRAAVTEVLESQRGVGGPQIVALEKAVAEYCRCRHAIGVSSGTDALLVSLMSLDIGRGDEVITTPFTFFATVGSIVRVGAKPVFVDIDPKTYNIDPSHIEAAVTPKTKAIMPVHLFGQMADMDPILAAAEKHGLAVIEDAAQAIGAEYNGRRAGSLGTCGCFSFYPSKNLGACGDGGMVVTNDDGLARRCELMRNHGAEERYYHRHVGGNFRLDSIQAAIVMVKLKYLESWHEARQRNAAYYNERFADCRAIQTPYVEPHNRMIYNQYVIRIPGKRDAVEAKLNEKKIGNAIYYPVPLHLQECFADIGHKEGDFPQAERAAREVLALPIYPELTREQLDEVADAVLEAVR
ncbi:MAG: DegT/DnrJ/EryC1/StrS family aminotransferase [Planctomycetota bacterium]|nr:DegT/DnrJ/EryC1/StrS family aminotransferase [Planctomycetota bacterium]